MTTKTEIRDFYGRLLGTIEETDDYKLARDFYGRIVGKFDKKANVTRDFYGRILSKGDTVVSTIYNNK